MMCEQQHKNCDKKGQKEKLTSPIENWDEARKLRWWWHDVTSDNPRQPPYPNSIIIGRGGDGIMMCEQQRKKCDKKGQKEKLTSPIDNWEPACRDEGRMRYGVVEGPANSWVLELVSALWETTTSAEGRCAGVDCSAVMC